MFVDVTVAAENSIFRPDCSGSGPRRARLGLVWRDRVGDGLPLGLLYELKLEEKPLKLVCRGL
jgi:hypothetical protein